MRGSKPRRRSKSGEPLPWASSEDFRLSNFGQSFYISVQKWTRKRHCPLRANCVTHV
nr:MAG TPA: hypothetical protein [Caudoviricetes sp.]